MPSVDPDPRYRIELTHPFIEAVREHLRAPGTLVVRQAQFDLLYTRGLARGGLPELAVVGVAERQLKAAERLITLYTAGEIEVTDVVEIVDEHLHRHRYRAADHDPRVHPDLPLARAAAQGEPLVAKVVDLMSCGCPTCRPAGRSARLSRSAIDPVDPLAQNLFDVLDLIDLHGWAVKEVRRPGGRLAYTVGLTEKSWPELAVTGVQPDEAGDLFRDVVHRFVDLGIPPATGMEFVLGDGRGRAVRLDPYLMPERSLPVAATLYSRPAYRLRALEVRLLD